MNAYKGTRSSEGQISGWIDIIFAARTAIISGRETQVGIGRRLGLVNLCNILSHILSKRNTRKERYDHQIPRRNQLQARLATAHTRAAVGDPCLPRKDARQLTPMPVAHESVGALLAAVEPANLCLGWADSVHATSNAESLKSLMQASRL